MIKRVLVAISALLLFPVLLLAQDHEPAWIAGPKFEVFGSIAMGHVFRFDDRGFGNHVNFGAGFEVPVWRKLRLGVEINRTFGFSPTAAKCGAILFSPGVPMPCVGTAREGVNSATSGSVTAAYYFGEGRIQPYLVGGINALRATEFYAQSILHGDYVEFSERESRSTGVGPTMGVGLRASLNRHVTLRPEIRFSDGTALSTLNLSQWRISIGAGYGW